MAGIVGAAGHSKTDGAADKMFLVSLSMLAKCTDAPAIPLFLNEISNIKGQLSSPSLLLNHMPEILKHKASGDIIVQAIYDYAHGRSLEDIYSRYDAMNDKIAASCSNFEEVIAYVVANIKDSE